MIDSKARETLFTNARTHFKWTDKPVTDETIHQLYELLKWAPTSANAAPARFVFVKSPEKKELLLSAVAEGNRVKTQTAPVTVIVAQDQRFFDQLPKLFPHMDLRSVMEANPAMAAETAFRNSSLQGAYLIMAARSLGLDVGPMSGFDAAKLDKLFFEGTNWKSNFLINLGYGDASALFPRGARLEFDEAAKIV